MSTTNVVHESEVQRQYVRVQLPLRVKVDGESYLALDWSNGGVALEWPDGMSRDKEAQKFVEGKILQGTLDFPFDEFDMTLPVDMEIRYVDREKHRIGCRFTNLSGQQISMLQYFVGAYISGEVVRAGDVMEVASRNHFVTQRKVPDATIGMTKGQLLVRKARMNMGMTLLMLFGFFLFCYVASGLYERFFVVTATGAQVDADVVILRVPGGGTVFYQPIETGTKVEKGKPLVMVSTDNGTMVSLDSPCDCLISKRDFRNYDRVKAFDGIIELVPVDAKPFISAMVPYAQAIRVGKGQTAMLKLPSQGLRMKGKVKEAQATGDTGAMVHVIITPDKELDPKLVSEPVDVRIDTF